MKQNGDGRAAQKRGRQEAEEADDQDLLPFGLDDFRVELSSREESQQNGPGGGQEPAAILCRRPANLVRSICMAPYADFNEGDGHPQMIGDDG